LIHFGSYNTEDVERYSGLTRSQGLTLLNRDLQTKFIPAVNRLVKVPLTQSQFDAIVSFTFNVGIGSTDPTKKPGFTRSRFLQELNRGNYNGNLMMNYHSPSELIPRRQDEVNLFRFGEY